MGSAGCSDADSDETFRLNSFYLFFCPLSVYLMRVFEFTLYTFAAVSGQINTVEATAYDAEGKGLYRLEDQEACWVFVPVEE